MANIQARRNKAGEVVSYSIRVHKGRDPVAGKQLKPYTTTWKVPDGWGEKRAEKEALKQADIRPQHLNLLYEQLSQPGIRGGFTEKAYAKVDFKALLKEKGLTMYGLEVKFPGNKHHSILSLCNGGAVKAETAKMIADVLEMSATAIFWYETDSRPLSGSTVGGYHTLVSTILAQAEKEMLIPYNPAAKATQLGHAHVSTTTDIYSHVIKEAEERISDCVADVILKPAKAKLRVVGD